MHMNELLQIHHGTQFGFARYYMLLYSIVLGLEAKKVFEFGIGESTKVILKALTKTKGVLFSCDVRSPKVCGISTKEQTSNWIFKQGRSTEVLRKVVTKGFDLVLHDGAHDGPTVFSDLRFIIPRMKQNGILLVHDTEHKYKDILEGIDNALENIEHQRVELPYGCGLSVIRIKEDFGNGKIVTTWKKKKV